jgi:hypothetical protein
MPDLEVDISGTTYKVSIDYEGYLSGASLSAEGRAYVARLAESIAEARRFAALRLLSSYNENWADSEENIYSVETFESKLILKKLVILDAPGYADIFFDDSDMFSGRVINVYMEGITPKDATLIG